MVYMHFAIITGCTKIKPQIIAFSKYEFYSELTELISSRINIPSEDMVEYMYDGQFRNHDTELTAHIPSQVSAIPHEHQISYYLTMSQVYSLIDDSSYNPDINYKDDRPLISLFMVINTPMYTSNYTTSNGPIDLIHILKSVKPYIPLPDPISESQISDNKLESDDSADNRSVDSTDDRSVKSADDRSVDSANDSVDNI